MLYEYLEVVNWRHVLIFMTVNMGCVVYNYYMPYYSEIGLKQLLLTLPFHCTVCTYSVHVQM